VIESLGNPHAYPLYRWWLVVAHQLMSADQVDLRGAFPPGSAGI
jgi:hypothetical protein